MDVQDFSVWQVAMAPPGPLPVPFGAAKRLTAAAGAANGRPKATATAVPLLSSTPLMQGEGS